MLHLVKDKLNCAEIEGVTMSRNIPMCSFFEKVGLSVVQKVYIDNCGDRHENQVNEADVEHSVYQGNVKNLLSKYDNKENFLYYRQENS